MNNEKIEISKQLEDINSKYNDLQQQKEQLETNNNELRQQNETMNNENYLLNQDSFKLDVYSFGMTLYFLITETKPFASYCIDSEGKEELRNDILNGKRPEFPKSIPKEWKKLIKNCWKQDQSKRPDFTQICRTLESFQFASNRINSKIFTFYKDEYLNDQKLEARID